MEEILLIILIGIFVVLIPIIALIDVLTSKFPGIKKIIWVLVILFFPFLGAVVYYFVGRKQKIDRT